MTTPTLPDADDDPLTETPGDDDPSQTPVDNPSGQLAIACDARIFTWSIGVQGV